MALVSFGVERGGRSILWDGMYTLSRQRQSVWAKRSLRAAKKQEGAIDSRQKCPRSPTPCKSLYTRYLQSRDLVQNGRNALLLRRRLRDAAPSVPLG